MQYGDYSIKTHKIPTYEMGMRAGMVWCRLFAFGRAQTKHLVHSHTRARHIVLCIYRAPAWGKNKVAECAFMGRLRLNWYSFWRFFFRWSLRTLNSTSTFITLLNHSLDWAFSLFIQPGVSKEWWIFAIPFIAQFKLHFVTKASILKQSPTGLVQFP